MGNKNTIDQQPPTTYEEAVRQLNWGAGNRSFRRTPNEDRYLAGTVNSLSPQAQPKEENQPRPEGLPEGISLADIARLAELFRT